MPAAVSIFITRLVPHYRDALFAALHRRCGLVVAAAAAAETTASALRIVDERPWLRLFRFRWISRRHQLVWVPVTAILKATRARVVVAEFSGHYTSTWELALRRRLTGGPRLIFWTHGYTAHRVGGRAIDRLLDFIRLWPLRSADAVACYTRASRDYLAQHIPAERLHVIDNSIDVAPMRRLRADAAVSAARPRPQLLATGRMTADKRFPMLVRVFRRLRERFPDAVLTIVGDGPDAAQVRAEAGDLLGTSVILPGLVYDEDLLAPYFMAADLFVFTGAVGLSVNHALAYGLPVVTFRDLPPGQAHHPEIAYVIDGETGWLVEPFGEDAMLAALTDILSAATPPRELLGARIDAFVDSNLTIEGMVDRFAAVIRSVSAAA